MKLSEYKGEEALEVLANIIEPAAEICADKEIADVFRNGGKKITAIKLAIKNHKRAVIEILAALEGEDPDKYNVGLLTLPVKLLEVLNDPELVQLFTSAGQMGGAKSSGSASEKTE